MMGQFETETVANYTIGIYWGSQHRLQFEFEQTQFVSLWDEIAVFVS